MSKFTYYSFVSVFAVVSSLAAPATRVAVVPDANLDAPAAYGVAELRRNIAARGMSVESSPERADLVILAGQSSEGQAARCGR